MRILVVCLLLIAHVALFAQSKKELQDQVNSLKAEIEQLKAPKVADLSTEHKRASYALGILMATNVRKQGGDSLDLDAITSGMKDVFQNKALKMNEQECMGVVQPYMQKAFQQKNAKLGAKAKEEGTAFLNTNKTKEGVVVTASGLQYKVVKQGAGKSPGLNDKVTVHYTGKLVDGTVFDSSEKTGQPATFGVTQVISGWTEALQLMHEGDKWTLYIPFELGYGERGNGQIPPYAALLFDIELIKVN